MTPRLPGARNAVPGSQNGVYSGLCLKMTLEVCLKMTPLPMPRENRCQEGIDAKRERIDAKRE